MTIKSGGAGIVHVLDILVRGCLLSFVFAFIPLTLLMLLVALALPTPRPHYGERPYEWLGIAYWAVLFGGTLASTLLYSYVRLIRRITFPEFIKEKPLLRRFVFTGMEKIGSGTDSVFTAAGKVFALLVFLVLVGIAIALLWWAGSAVFSSAPWWAIVIIVLLILILFK